jgi:multisubunit Na+/H+ antiporter MnhC subunit
VIIDLYNYTLICVCALTLCGIYCILVSRNFIRILIGVELLTKGVTLLLGLGGYLTGNTALSQALILSLIVIEVVVIATGAGIVISAFRHTGNLDNRQLRDLKG